MKNAFLLGLREDGLKLCLELISKPEFTNYKEEAEYYISERFFYEFITQDKPSMEIINQSYTFYTKYSQEYPNGKYIELVKSRISHIRNTFSNYLAFGILDDNLQNERKIVSKYFEYFDLFAEIQPPNWYDFYFEGNNEQSIKVVDNYYENIAKNYPNFSIYALNNIFFIKLSPLYKTGLVKSKLLKLEGEDKTVYRDINKEKEKILKSAEEVLQRMIEVAPLNSLTFDAHLILAYNYTTRNMWGKLVLDKKVLDLLNYVLNNEKDITSPRYILTKEFILNNKFD